MKKNIIIASLKAIIPAGALLMACASSYAPPITPTLTLTEVSANSLTYSWNGPNPASGTVMASPSDYWQFTISDDVVSSLGDTQNVNANWKEPDWATSGLVNWVNFYQYGPAANGTVITVSSDHQPTGQFQPGYPLLENGSTYNFDPISGANISMFSDLGDEPGVPDGGVTVGLLGMGMMALAAFRRKFIFVTA